MRRIITTAVLGLTLLGAAAACADTTEPTTPGTSPSAAVTSAAAAAKATKDETCAEIKKLLEETKVSSTALVMEIFAAAADPTKAEATLMKFAEFAEDQLAEGTRIAAGASDPELKAALDEMIAEYTKLAADVKAANGDLDKATDLMDENTGASAIKLGALCGITV